MVELAFDAERRTCLVAWAREVIPQLHLLQKSPFTTPVVADLAAQVEQFGKDLALLRTQVRRRASVVPFAPPRMFIRALGRIEVKIADRLVTGFDWQTQTARDLLFFILSHPEGLTKEMIGLVFWQDASPAELRLRFKNVVYRLRHAAGRDVIVYQDEYYRFNSAIDYEYDVEIFQKEAAQIQQVEDIQLKIQHSKAAIQAYRGPYLPEVEETWVIMERERLYQIYMDTLLKLAGYYLETRQHDAALEICLEALREDPCLEAAHRSAMRIHAAIGNRAAVLRQYELCRQALLAEFDAAPSPQTDQLFAILTR
jgi:two-component SAPR family response regulator